MDTQTIISIIQFEKDDGDEGFKVTTNQQCITLFMNMTLEGNQFPDHFLTEEDVECFVNAELFNIKITNMLDKPELLPTPKYDAHGIAFEEPEMMFVELVTSKGTLPLVAYDIIQVYDHEAFQQYRRGFIA